MFNSKYDCKLDPKGRLVLPAKIKSAIPEANGPVLMLRIAEDGCIALYPMVEYRKLENQIKSLSINNPEQRKLQRLFFATSVEVELDNTGRFLIPKSYQAYAGLEKDVVVLGMGSRIEIWNKDKYQEENPEESGDLFELMQKFLP